MKHRPMLLIYFFAALFALMIGIQWYFLRNSYALKKQELLTEVKSKLKNLEDDVDIFDDDLVKDDSALYRFVQLERKEITENDLKLVYQDVSNKIKPRLTQYVDSVFHPLGYQVSVSKEILSIYSHNLKEWLVKEPFLVYQTMRAPKNPIPLSSGRWETSSHSVETKGEDELSKVSKTKYFAYTVNRASYFELENLSWILFRDLIGLYLISFLILTAILILFYKSYKNLQEQKRQIENLHDMVDNVSHEMRTPVATLKIVSKSLEKAPNPAVLQVLSRQVDRLEQLLKPLTETEFQEGILYFDQEDLDQYLIDFSFANPQVNVSSQKLPLSPLTIEKKDMETILSNLFSNSVKYGAKELNLQFVQTDQVLKISVSDDGDGIDKKDQPYIFEKFFRIQKDSQYNSTGMGLGLYLVRKVIQKYKGQITVESDRTWGSCFQISIPYGE